MYFTNGDGELRRVPITGGPAVLLGAAARPGGPVALNDDNVYWVSGEEPGVVASASKDDKGGGARPLAAGQHYPFGIAVDAKRIYWVSAMIGLVEVTGSIRACPFGDCASPMVIADKQRTPKDLAVDDVAIYWTAHDMGNGHGGIYKVAKP